MLDDISFVVGHEDKIAFVGSNGLAKTTLFQILAGEMEPDEGSYKGELQLLSHISLRTTQKTSIVTTSLLTG